MLIGEFINLNKCILYFSMCEIIFITSVYIDFHDMQLLYEFGIWLYTIMSSYMYIEHTWNIDKT